MSTEDKKAISRRITEEAFVGGNLEVVSELVGPDYVGHDPAALEEIRGPEGLKQMIATYREAYPDLTLTTEEEIAEGDFVVSRWSASGTHQGDLWGIPPTGKETKVTGITIDRFEGDKIVESWTNWDTFGLMQQLGVAPQHTTA